MLQVLHEQYKRIHHIVTSLLNFCVGTPMSRHIHTAVAVCILLSEIWEGNCGSYIALIFTVSEFKDKEREMSMVAERPHTE